MSRRKVSRRQFLKTSGVATAGALAVTAAPGRAATETEVTLYIVPNTHGTIGGWLCTFDTERNYVLNNYLDHLDRVSSDPYYTFAFSEVPNFITFLQFTPDRLAELKERAGERRVELCNGFFLESAISLSDGEALVQLGVQGMRWYQAVFGRRPRFGWTIDVVGNHRQMPQIAAGLGFDAMLFCRNNPARKTAFWWVAPDGTRMLTVCNASSYAELPKLFTTEQPLAASDFEEIAKLVEWKRRHSPSEKTLLALGGSGDYSLAPLRKEYPAEFLGAWRRRYPGIEIRFGILADYVDALRAEVRAGRTKLEEYRGDAAYCFNAFWYDMPQVKHRFRRCEHLLHAAEMLATAASLRAKAAYPSQDLHDAWTNLLVNMDRNTLWGSAAGNVFHDSDSWDAEDRFSSVEERTLRVIDESLAALLGPGGDFVLFNPLNWRRRDPAEIRLPDGKTPASVVCEARQDDPSYVICDLELPATGFAVVRLKTGSPAQPREIEFSGGVETDYYLASIDRKTGTLESLKLKSSGREVLAGPSNSVAAESVAGILKADPGDYMLPRPQRRMVDASERYRPAIRAVAGPVALTVVISSDFYGGSKLERTIRFYHHHPRIDFEIDLDLRAQEVLMTTSFLLADDVIQRTRGIPFGFATIDPQHPYRPLKDYMVGEAETYGFSDAILPAVRWSHYRLNNGSGVALVDRGLTGHELNGRTVTLGLINAHSHYNGLPNSLMAGQGRHRFSYALVPHAGSWQQAKIPQLAWEYNAPILARANSQTSRPASLLVTSDNLILAAMRRQGSQIELRLCEWQGSAGEAEITVNLQHSGAALTNFMGEKSTPLAGGPTYKFPIRPQQIVTLRLETPSSAANPEVIRDWKRLVPAAKQRDLARRINLKGHPPFGPKN